LQAAEAAADALAPGPALPLAAGALAAGALAASVGEGVVLPPDEHPVTIAMVARDAANDVQRRMLGPPRMGALRRRTSSSTWTAASYAGGASVNNASVACTRRCQLETLESPQDVIVA